MHVRVFLHVTQADIPCTRHTPPTHAGAVKITPAHDPNDFLTGKRHSLENINILDDDGNINGNGTGPFAGQPRFKWVGSMQQHGVCG